MGESKSPLTRVCGIDRLIESLLASPISISISPREECKNTHQRRSVIPPAHTLTLLFPPKAEFGVIQGAWGEDEASWTMRG